MKNLTRTLAVLTLLPFGSCSSSTTSTAAPAVVLGWHTDLADAKAAAEATGRPILADFTGSDWCVWCQRLKAEVFDTSAFAAWSAQRVVLLELDFPHATPQAPEVAAANAKLASDYGISGFPTIVFLDKNGRALGNLGYQAGGPDSWISAAERIIGSAK